MATRSSIAMLLPNKDIRVVYCHWDGYLSHNGLYLSSFYTTPELVEELISHGDLSSLGSKINPDPTMPHTFDTKQEDVCVYYGRDRGEDDTGYKQVSHTDYSDYYQEYDYLYANNKWYVRIESVLVDLDWAVAHDQQIYDAVDNNSFSKLAIKLANKQLVVQLEDLVDSE